MSDLKSKLPDINEITSMAGKLFKDVKKSITEIISDYKSKHPAVAEEDVANEKKTAKPKKSKQGTPEIKPTEDESHNHAKKDDVE